MGFLCVLGTHTEGKHTAQPHIFLWKPALMCLSKDNLYTKIHYNKMKKETNSSLSSVS